MRYQPQGRAKLHKGGLADLLVASVTASQYQSGALDRPIKLASGVSRVVTQHGIAFQGAAVNGNIDFGVTAGLGSLIPPGKPFSIYMRLSVPVLGQRQGLISDHHSGGSGDSAMVEITAANEWRFNVNAPAAFNILAAGVTLGQHDVLAVHVPRVGTYLYVDGALVGSIGFLNELNTGSTLRLGALGTYTTGLGFRGRIHVCHIFRADVSAQRFELLANPWSVYAAPEEEYEVAAVGGGPTNSTGTFASSLASVSMAASGDIINAGSFYSALSGVTMLSSGTIADSPVGSFAASMDGVTMNAAGSLLNAGSFASLMQGAGMTASGIVAQHATGTLASTLGGATMAAYGAVGDDASASGVVPHRYRWRVMRRHFDN